MTTIKGISILGFLAVIVFGVMSMTAAPITKSKEQVYSDLTAQINYEISHGETKHGGDSELARSCIKKYGADLTYSRDDTRRITLCLITDGKVGLAVQVVEKIQGKWQELTAFCNWDVTTIEAAIGFAEQDMGKYGMFTFVKEVWKYLFH